MLIWNHQRGSSPLARGTLGGKPKIQVEEGLIPARAGNTRRRAHPPGLPRAHPRSRGEHSRKKYLAKLDKGSSPLARGTHIELDHLNVVDGLIPARAGNTWESDTQRTPHGAHPRSRGEHGENFGITTLRKGSSPLARGTRRCKRIKSVKHGLIPARAGNTRGGSQTTTLNGAHPRSRGEHASPRRPTAAAPGSSPLARGTRLTTKSIKPIKGLIPARAGNTGKCF